jgi:hypothetical protein
MKYGKLFDVKGEVSATLTIPWTYLMSNGIAISEMGCDVGALRRVPPGARITMESHMSPRTLANDVNISADITSAKCTG